MFNAHISTFPLLNFNLNFKIFIRQFYEKSYNYFNFRYIFDKGSIFDVDVFFFCIVFLVKKNLLLTFIWKYNQSICAVPPELERINPKCSLN